MIYTILGRCQRAGRLGFGIATFSITVGLYCNGVAANRRVPPLRLPSTALEAGAAPGSGRDDGIILARGA